MTKRKIVQMFGDKPNTGQYDNGVWQDVLKIPYVQKTDRLEDYDVVISTLWLEAIGRCKEIKSRWPHIKLIGLSDHPLSTHVSKMSPAQQIAYLRDLEYVDGLLALTEEERQFYQTALPSKPVIKGGLPFPFESYTKDYGQFVNSEKKYIGLGVGASDNDRNFLSSFIVFQRLKLEFPEIKGLFLSIPSNMISQVNTYAMVSDSIFIHEREDMGSFYDALSQCRFVINLADRNTPGRIQGEAAFFGVPVIGSNRLELQNELFPDLATSPYSLEEAVNLATRLLLDPEIGTRLAEVASKRLNKYNYAKSRAKFNSLLAEIDARG